jgi:hypothetical protein
VGQNPRSHCRRLRGWVIDATSVAAGGPSAATPTETVRRGVAASNDRKRGTPPNEYVKHLFTPAFGRGISRSLLALRRVESGGTHPICLRRASLWPPLR